MKRGIRVKEGEDLSPAKIKEVIGQLTKDKPITKKDACAMLNIAYNTTRLNKIITEYQETQEYHARRKKELRNKPLTKEDIGYIISSYLEEGNLSILIETTHRSLNVIKRVLNKYNIPLRDASITYHNPINLPEEAIIEEYNLDDLVYSARYDEPAYISKSVDNDGLGKVYRIWLIKSEQYACQPFYELANLHEVQSNLNVTIETKKWIEDIYPEIAITLNNARKKKRE